MVIVDYEDDESVIDPIFMKMSTSDGILLVFPTQEFYDLYKEELLNVYKLMYKLVREEYGIYANNQCKFVKNIDEFNDSDSMYMEDLISENTNK